MKFLSMDIEAAIFDLDGTLLDSTHLWGEIDVRFFARRGLSVPSSYAQEIAHIGLKGAAKFTRERYCPNETEEEILAEWHALSQEAYAKEIPAKNGAIAFLEALKKRKIPMALATANSPSLYLPALKRLGMEEYFSFLIDAEKCQEGKGNSKIYDLACEALHSQRGKTLVFEDSLQPMKEAEKAGYPVICIYDRHSCHDEAEHRAHCLYFASSGEELLCKLEED